MGRRRVAPLVFLVLAGLIYPAASPADHTTTTATVSAQLKERRTADAWTVEISWAAECHGAAGHIVFNGELYLVNVDTGERIHTGGVVSTSGQRTFSGKRDWYVDSREREQHLKPELIISCYQSFPQDGGPSSVVTGNQVTIPPAFSGGGGSGGGGSGGGDYGQGDPTAPLGSGGCGNALMGTNGPETLTGGAEGDVIFGLGGKDLIRGRRGHDCLIGGSGDDRLEGQLGADRLTGGRGRDVLVGGPGVNAYDAGPGNDYVNARNARREMVRCGRGRDRARVDRRDRVVSCERGSRPR